MAASSLSSSFCMQLILSTATCFSVFRRLATSLPRPYIAGQRRPLRFIHFMRLRFRRPLGVAIALVVLVAFDYFVLDGKHIHAVKMTLISLSHSF
jgi:hypothetical protein